MSDELKPCPFCGGDAMTCFDDERMIFRHSVECIVCGGRSCWYSTKDVAAVAWNARAERTCHFSLEEDREMLAEKAACGPGEFVTQDMPDLLWTCSACGEQYGNGLDALPGWLKHCPNCGAKVAPC